MASNRVAEDLESINMDEATVTSALLTPKGGRRPWYRINTYMLPAKAAFAGAHMAFGAYLPNAGVFLTSIGLSKTQAGSILGVRTLADIIGNPIWGAVADKTRAPKLVLVFLLVMSLCLVFPQPWIAHRVEPVHKYKVCENRLPEVPVNASGNVNPRPSWVTGTPNNNATSSGDCESVVQAASSKLFFVMLALSPLGYFFAGSVSNVIETRVLRLVETSPVPATYGQQRYFGSITFGISSVIAGVLADNFRHEGMSSFTAVFYWYCCGLLVLVVVVCTCLFRAKVQLVETEKKEQSNVWSLVFSTVRRIHMILFFVTVLVTGIAAGVLYGFLFIYLEELSVSKSVMGLNILLSCAVELLIFPVATRIIRLVRGNRVAMAIGVFMYFPRHLMVSYFTNVWLILSTHVLHSLCFALFWAAAVDYVYQECPKEVLTTVLGIMNSVYNGLGQLIANFLGGLIYDALGGQMLFRLAGILCIAWSLIWSIYIAFDCNRRNALKKVEA